MTGHERTNNNDYNCIICVRYNEYANKAFSFVYWIFLNAESI